MHILCEMSGLEGYLFAPGPEEDSGFHISAPNVSFLQEPGWGSEQGREDKRGVFAVAAAEAVGLPGMIPHVFNGCPCSIDPGWAGEKRGRKQREK